MNTTKVQRSLAAIIALAGMANEELLRSIHPPECDEEESLRGRRCFRNTMSSLFASITALKAEVDRG